MNSSCHVIQTKAKEFAGYYYIQLFAIAFWTAELILLSKSMHNELLQNHLSQTKPRYAEIVKLQPPALRFRVSLVVNNYNQTDQRMLYSFEYLVLEFVVCLFQ